MLFFIYYNHNFDIKTSRMQGYLDVWQGFFARWTKYYFRIHQDTLIFGPKRQQIQGKVHLGVAQIISIVDDPISFIIHTGTDSLRVRANSIDERVKWFKKLKKIQKDIEQANYAKQISLMNEQKGKSNRIKLLQSIVVQLWQSQAELQNQIDDISSRFKTLPGVKNLTDKLRMTVQSIKLKSSQALRIIQQYSKSGYVRRQSVNVKNLFDINQDFSDQNSDYHQLNGTQFMSFDNNNKNFALFKKPSKRQSYNENIAQYKEIPTSSTKKILDKSSSMVQPFKIKSSRLSSSKQPINSQNSIKQTLLESNPIFLQMKKSLSSNRTRLALPHKFTPQQKFPLASVLKGSIGVGSDLTKFSLPVTVNQPLSILQKGCEQMYYSQLLDLANNQQTPQKRMLYVVTFLISQYSLTDLRIKKPFNPLLGQTFEFYDEQRQFSYISQQVSHHPPISAMHCRSDTFQIFDQSQAKTSFTGTSIKVIPEGKSKLTLQRDLTEVYKYNKCIISMNNLVVGKTTIQITGDLNIQCKKTGAAAKITFKQGSFFNKNAMNSIEGQIKIQGKLCYTITGKWNQHIKATSAKDNLTVTTWTRKHTCNKDYYYFNDYTMVLNHLNKQNLAEIAPTDSRLRPDQRALQYQNLDLAGSQKNRLEEKQRAKRKQMQKKGAVHKMKWFNLKRDGDGDQYFENNHEYESQRKRGDWTSFPDIFT